MLMLYKSKLGDFWLLGFVQLRPYRLQPQRLAFRVPGETIAPELRKIHKVDSHEASRSNCIWDTYDKIPISRARSGPRDVTWRKFVSKGYDFCHGGPVSQEAAPRVARGGTCRVARKRPAASRFLPEDERHAVLLAMERHPCRWEVRHGSHVHTCLYCDVGVFYGPKIVTITILIFSITINIV